MNTLPLVSAFLIGLAGSVHCVGMCGGIVSALTLTRSQVRPFPVPVVVNAVHTVRAVHAAPMIPATPVAGAVQQNVSWTTSVWWRGLSYNGGRIASYAIAGAMVGGLARGLTLLGDVHSLRVTMFWASNLMLVALGLYLMGLHSGIAQIESFGRRAWQALQPLTRKLLQVSGTSQLFMAGMVWGWLPCGMVYSMLLTAMLAGSATSGALVMIAFGTGTVPAMLLIGYLGSKLVGHRHFVDLRLVAGALVLGFGILGLVHAAQGMPNGILGAICVGADLSGSAP